MSEITEEQRQGWLDYRLADVEAGGADQIESDEYEITNGDGNWAYISISALCGEALSEITQLRQQLAELKEVNDKWHDYAKNEGVRRQGEIATAIAKAQPEAGEACGYVSQGHMTTVHFDESTEFGTAIPDGAKLYLHPAPVVPMTPYLKNRADAVDGHYCIARLTNHGYSEFWNEEADKWCSAGSVFNLGKVMLKEA